MSIFKMSAFKHLDSQGRYKHHIATYDENRDENGIKIESLEEFIFDKSPQAPIHETQAQLF